MAGSNWTEADVRRHQARLSSGKQAAAPTEKPSKYHNVKVVVDGLKFDSKHEAAVYQTLKLRQRAGEIRDLACQVRFALYAPDLAAAAEGRFVSLQVAEYVADFTYVAVATGRQHAVDAKGQKRRICPYPLKAKWLELQNGIAIEEV